MAAAKIGVLIVNLGTPDGTDFWSMRRYLGEFLSDRRVIELPRALWYPILHGMVLSTRPQKSGVKYARIWNFDRAESPLRTFTRSQAEKLQERMGADDVNISWAMRYGQPSVKNVTRRMIKQGCHRILLFALYPQYAASTIASVYDAFFDSLKDERFVPAIRTVPAYPDDPVYIQAVARSINDHLRTLDHKPERILASFHGLPEAYVQRGDPYYDQCERTVSALRTFMGLSSDEMIMTFQSRFGKQEWLKPYTQSTVERLAEQGVKSLTVCNPGFVADCLETLDEVGREIGESFIDKGGTHFSHVPCLNDTELGLDVIEHIVRRELAGWLA